MEQWEHTPVQPRKPRPTPRGAMTRYDDMDESGGGISVSGHAPGAPRPSYSDSRGDTDWDLAWHGPGPADPAPRTDRYGGSGGGSGGGQQAGRRPRWRRPSWRAMLGATAIIATFAVVATSLVAYAKYRGVLGSIHRENVTSAMLGKRPPYTAGLNILIIGSDSRQGLGNTFGADVARAHVRTPRCCCTSRPDTPGPTSSASPATRWCRSWPAPTTGQGHPGQSAQPGQLERLNATFSAGGAPVPVEDAGAGNRHPYPALRGSELRRLPVDRQRRGRRAGLPAVRDQQPPVQAAPLGRASTWSTGRRRSPSSGSGRTSARARTSSASSASSTSWPRSCRSSRSTNLLAQPNRIFAVVRDVAKSLTTDSGLDLSTMLRIANSMKSLSSSSVQFITVPVVPYAGDPAAELSWAAAAGGPPVPGHRGRPQPACRRQGRPRGRAAPTRPRRCPRSARPRCTSRC